MPARRNSEGQPLRHLRNWYCPERWCVYAFAKASGAQECKASAHFISMPHTEISFRALAPRLAIIGQVCVRRMPLNYCTAAKCHSLGKREPRARRHSLATDTERRDGNDARPRRNHHCTPTDHTPGEEESGTSAIISPNTQHPADLDDERTYTARAFEKVKNADDF